MNYTRQQVNNAVNRAVLELPERTSVFASLAMGRLPGDRSSTYTREDVSAAVNAAADEMSPDMDDPDTYETSDTIRQQDIANLFVNLAMGFLDQPGATANEIIEASYGEDPATVWGWVR